MKVYMFKPQFAALVKSGTKRQTIRPHRKHPTKVGDVLSFRQWEGPAYHSKQVVIGEAVCNEVHGFDIFTLTGGVYVAFLDGQQITTEGWDEVARLDGFADAKDMLKWFKENHDILTFYGDLIRW